MLPVIGPVATIQSRPPSGANTYHSANRMFPGKNFEPEAVTTFAGVVPVASDAVADSKRRCRGQRRCRNLQQHRAARLKRKPIGNLWRK